MKANTLPNQTFTLLQKHLKLGVARIEFADLSSNSVGCKMGRACHAIHHSSQLSEITVNILKERERDRERHGDTETERDRERDIQTDKSVRGREEGGERERLFVMIMQAPVSI